MNYTFNNLVVFAATVDGTGGSGSVTPNPMSVITLNANETISFDETETNVGNGMDTTTGIFTVPKSGIYSFSFSGYVRQSEYDDQEALWRVYQTDESETELSTLDLFHQSVPDQNYRSIFDYTWVMSLEQGNTIYLKSPTKLYLHQARFEGQLVMYT